MLPQLDFFGRDCIFPDVFYSRNYLSGSDDVLLVVFLLCCERLKFLENLNLSDLHWGKKSTVRTWASPSIHIIRVFLETSRQFCCHWSRLNRICLSLQYTWGKVSKSDHPCAGDTAVIQSMEVFFMLLIK